MSFDYRIEEINIILHVQPHQQINTVTLQVKRNAGTSLHDQSMEKKMICSYRKVDYSARKLSALSSLAVPELEDSPIASGEDATGNGSLLKVDGIPDIS